MDVPKPVSKGGPPIPFDLLVDIYQSEHDIPTRAEVFRLIAEANGNTIKAVATRYHDANGHHVWWGTPNRRERAELQAANPEPDMRERHKAVCGVTHSLAYLRLQKLLPRHSQIALVTIVEIDGDGIHIGFDVEDVPPQTLIRLLRDAADRLEELQS